MPRGGFTVGGRGGRGGASRGGVVGTTRGGSSAVRGVSHGRGGRGGSGGRGGRGGRGGFRPSMASVPRAAPSLGSETKPVMELQSRISPVEEYLIATAANFLQEKETQRTASNSTANTTHNRLCDALDSLSGLGSEGTPDALTANGAPCFQSSRDATVDLFFQMARGATHEAIACLMKDSWRQSPEQTLQIVLQARDCRDGRGERLIAYYALTWLRQHKPSTYINLLPYVVRFGSFRDLNVLAQMATAELNKVATQSNPHMQAKGMSKWKRARDRRLTDHAQQQKAKRAKTETETETEKQESAASSVPTAASNSTEVEHVRNNDEPVLYPNANANVNVNVNDTDSADVDMVTNNVPVVIEPSLEVVAGELPELAMMAEAIRHDLATLRDWKLRKPTTIASDSTSSTSTSLSTTDTLTASICPGLSLAGKWIPTEGKSDDCQSRLASRLARLLFPNVAQHSSRMRMYRINLTKLRAQLRLVETSMSRGTWDSIVYGQLPSRAHHRLKRAFLKHSADRYKTYLTSLRAVQEQTKAATLAAEAAEDAEENGEAVLEVVEEQKVEDAESEEEIEALDPTLKINTVGVFPHEVLKPWISGASYSYYSTPTMEADEATQRIAQWEDIVARMRSEGNLRRALAVVDVSGSMNGTPMEVALSLGLLISEVARAPFKDRFITFSSYPAWHIIQGATIQQKLSDMARAQWCMSTNLEAVFTLLLDTAVQNKVTQSDLPSLLIILTDMQFSACMSSSDQTVFQNARSRFTTAGYQLPAVCFWNLNSGSCHSTPVQHNDQGVMLLNGYSPALLKVLMQDEDITKNMAEFTPAKMLGKSLVAYDQAVPWSTVISNRER